MAHQPLPTQSEHMPNNTPDSTTKRLSHQYWLKQHYAIDHIALKPLCGDAGSRRYFRFFLDDQSLILTDFSREPTSMQSFCQHTQALSACGLPVPHIKVVDQHNHYLIQDDLGDTTLLQHITHTPVATASLYPKAIALLMQLQQHSTDLQHLPLLTIHAIQQELDCFDHWYCDRYLGKPLSTTERQIWQTCCHNMAHAMRQQPQVAVHRDFHSRNLMVSAETMTMIDYQDAVLGPVGYDIISLVYDCYINHPASQQQQWLQQHYQMLQHHQCIPANISLATYQAWCGVCAGQRLLKILGVFSRLGLRDKKTHFLDDLALTYQHLTTCIASQPILQPLQPLLSTRPPKR